MPASDKEVEKLITDLRGKFWQVLTKYRNRFTQVYEIYKENTYLLNYLTYFTYLT